jgi:CHAD domain-containing protein
LPRKLSSAEERELEYLRSRSLLILDFLVEHSDEPFPSAPELRDIVEQTGRAGDLRGMRIIRSEFLDMSRALPTEHQRALAELLKAQAADDPFSADGTV